MWFLSLYWKFLFVFEENEVYDDFLVGNCEEWFVEVVVYDVCFGYWIVDLVECDDVGMFGVCCLFVDFDEWFGVELVFDWKIILC